MSKRGEVSLVLLSLLLEPVSEDGRSPERRNAGDGWDGMTTTGAPTASLPRI